MRHPRWFSQLSHEQVAARPNPALVQRRIDVQRDGRFSYGSASGLAGMNREQAPVGHDNRMNEMTAERIMTVQSAPFSTACRPRRNTTTQRYGRT